MLDPAIAEQVHAASDGAVLAEMNDHILIVSINRPEARNAISQRVALGLGTALECADRDRDVRVVIITGTGELSFCAGADLKEAASPPAPADPRLIEWGFGGFARHEISTPIIAAVNGFALGGGTELVLASDLAVAADHATFGQPEVRRGILAAAGGAFRLPQQIPRKAAMELLLTGESITAASALTLGLVNRVVPLVDLMPTAIELAQRIAANSPLAVQSTKRLAKSVRDDTAEDETEHWARTHEEARRLMKSADAREGLLAFAEKRIPQWKGQ